MSASDARGCNRRGVARVPRASLALVAIILAVGLGQRSGSSASFSDAVSPAAEGSAASSYSALLGDVLRRRSRDEDVHSGSQHLLRGMGAAARRSVPPRRDVPDRRTRKRKSSMAIRTSDVLKDILRGRDKEHGSDQSASDAGAGQPISKRMKEGHVSGARAEWAKAVGAQSCALREERGDGGRGDGGRMRMRAVAGSDSGVSRAEGRKLDLDGGLDMVHVQGLEDGWWQHQVPTANLTTAPTPALVEYAGLSAAIAALNDRTAVRHVVETANSSVGSSAVAQQGQREPRWAAPGFLEPLQVFAREVNSRGARVFVVSAPSEFWEVYRLLGRANASRHYYEVLLEARPCRLYMDLEFKICNATYAAEKEGRGGKAAEAGGAGAAGGPGAAASPASLSFPHALARGNRLVARLRDIMAAFLRHAIAEQQARGGRSLSQSQVPALLQAVELDASTPAKFSRHLIFPGFVVASTQHAGAFMRALAASPNMTSDVRELIDMSVYSRNRCFRLVGSTKLGKDKPFCLLPDSEGAWREKGSMLLQPRLDGGEAMVLGASGQTMARSPDDDGEDGRRTFLQSLACIVSAGDQVLSLATDAVHDSGAEGSDASASHHLPVPSGLQLRISQADLDVAKLRVVPGGRNAGVGLSGGVGGGGGGISAPEGLEKLVEWVCSEIRPGAALAYAKQVPGYVVLGLARNRFCENIGRHHKGNRILIIIQLYPQLLLSGSSAITIANESCLERESSSRQTSAAEDGNRDVARRGGLWWQRCQDPDCRAIDFRSTKRVVPRHIMLTVPRWQEQAPQSTCERDYECQDEDIKDEDMKRILGDSCGEEEGEATYSGLHAEHCEDEEEIELSSV